MGGQMYHEIVAQQAILSVCDSASAITITRLLKTASKMLCPRYTANSSPAEQNV